MFHGRGIIADQRKAYTLAIDAYSKAIAINPKDDFAYGRRAQANFDEGHADAALADAQKATELKPDFLNMYGLRVYIFTTRKKPDEAAFRPTLPVAAPAHPADGAIFSAASYSPLYSGTRAHAVGDMVTILLMESTTAAKTVGSKSQKAGGASLTPPKAGPLAVNPDALSASSNSTFNGQGNASQTSTLSSTLSVTIAAGGR